MKQYRRCTIQVSPELHQRLVRVAAEILAAKEQSLGYENVPLVEQGERGVWVSPAAVIARALDDFEAHRARSNPRPWKNAESPQ